jgi:uncharacterized membrane protein
MSRATKYKKGVIDMNFERGKMWRFVSFGSFAISAVFTIMLYTSGTVGALAFILSVGMGILLEVAKCGLLYEAISSSFNGWFRALFGTISAILIVVSIFASASYVQNQSNEVKNLAMKKASKIADEKSERASKESKAMYEQSKKDAETATMIETSLYNDKKREIEELRKTQERINNEGIASIQNLPANQKTKKFEETRKLRKEIEKMQSVIDAKSNELASIAPKARQIEYRTVETQSTEKVVSTGGYTAMFEAMAQSYNRNYGEENPISTEEMELYFFIFLGFVFEVMAVVTAFLAQMYSAEDATPPLSAPASAPAPQEMSYGIQAPAPQEYEIPVLKKKYL